jgi:hypothetical protein
MSIPARCVVVVRRGEREVFDRLRAELGAEIEVIWDRRVRDRRVIIQDVADERRRGERRAPVDATFWTTRGYIMTRSSAGEAAVTLRRPRPRHRREGLRGSGNGPER